MQLVQHGVPAVLHDVHIDAQLMGLRSLQRACCGLQHALQDVIAVLNTATSQQSSLHLSQCTGSHLTQWASVSSAAEAAATQSAAGQPPPSASSSSRPADQQKPTGHSTIQASADRGGRTSSLQGAGRRSGPGASVPVTVGPAGGSQGGPLARAGSRSRAPSVPKLEQHGSGQVSDLALENAPTKVLQLIGDPRTGVADDVTTNPFGGVTVDMVHYQQSNEVYWYKYELGAEQLQHAHRNGRLSEYARNLMYLLRAKDPARWSIDALAQKFRIRPQRVMAILALKEMEAHAMEQGAALQGPLSAYACTVHLDDITLDAQGNLVDCNSPLQQQQLAAQVKAATQVGDPSTVLSRASKGSEQVINPAVLPLHNQLPRARLVSQQVQQQLTQLLGSYQYDLQGARTQQLEGIDNAIKSVQAALPADVLTPAEDQDQAAEATKSGSTATPGSVDAGAQVLRALTALREAVAGLFDTLQEALLAPAVTGGTAQASAGEGSSSGNTGSGFQGWRSALLEAERQVGLAAQQAGQWLSHLSAGGETAGSTLGQLEALVSSLGDNQVGQLIAGLPMEQRGLLLEKVPAAAARLNVLGADVSALKTKQQLGGTGGSTQLTDVLDFTYISPMQYAAITQGLRAVQAAEAAVTTATAALSGRAGDADTTAVAGSSSGDNWLKSLVRTSEAYRATLLAHQQQSPTQRKVSRNPLQLLQLMHSADPGVLERITMLEAALQLERAGDQDTAQQVRANLRQASGQQLASEAPALDPVKYIGGVGDPALGARAGSASSWDALSAWLEAQPGGRLYHRGTGERQLARLPTYPAFQGAPISALDGVSEGQLSALNRQLADRQQEELQARFAQDLMFNLGLDGQGVWDGSQPRAGPNLESRLDTMSLVVYDIKQDGTTVYPPKFVVEPDGSKRPLDERELVWQGRRARELLPNSKLVHYSMKRIKRKPELL